MSYSTPLQQLAQARDLHETEEEKWKDKEEALQRQLKEVTERSDVVESALQDTEAACRGRASDREAVLLESQSGGGYAPAAGCLRGPQ